MVAFSISQAIIKAALKGLKLWPQRLHVNGKPRLTKFYDSMSKRKYLSKLKGSSRFYKDIDVLLNQGVMVSEIEEII